MSYRLPLLLPGYRQPGFRCQILRNRNSEHGGRWSYQAIGQPVGGPRLPCKKKDNSWRFCVDYRRVNAVTRKDSYPLDYISGSKWFSSLAFLGHVLSAGGVATDPAKITAVRDWPPPTNISDLQSFLDLASYYRRYVRNFAIIARPLHCLTDCGQPYVWDYPCAQAFNALQTALIMAPVLAYPDANRPFILDTDASNVGVGAVLSQPSDSREQVIAYYSHALNKTERNYCVTRRELLTVIAILWHFRPYLHGTRFFVRTNHTSLTRLLNFKNPEGQVARWLESLQGYDFELRHLWAYRTARQESSRCTPASLMFGRELRTPVDLVFGPPPEPEVEGGPEIDYLRQLQERLQVAHDFTRQAQAGSGVKQKRAYDTRCRGQAFAPEVVYQVRMPGRGREVVLHQDRLAPYQPLAQAAAEAAGESPRPLSPRDSLSAPGGGRRRTPRHR
ncbi:hypothetical protein AAFF_G00017620 [Aldrovandia affinis]|uniref:Reverse transcriptase/retrotransposon-derived protein RNase H-like domain-containing protein n=1 Tax=Aldrovandia affinis TaxID=143900 RepID=A0AAD7S7Z7_9TELE|nr:hypothetical protein AAFF_G00017620 [Aldrovandia affinis]